MEHAQRQKRAHPKVRSGCSVCKARKIKCDESKPTCSRCQTSGRQCTYAVPKAWLFEPLKLLPSPKKQQTLTLGTQDEQRSFHFFKELTAPQFAGQHQLAQGFWNQFVVQAACSDPLVFKLAVAMGARHEASHTGSQDLELLATKTHATALTVLARNLSYMKVDTSLLCCTLLGAYANLCEEVPATAAMHISLGLKIIREETIPRYHNLSDSMAAYIVPMFAELELATAIFTIPSIDVEMHCPDSEHMPNVPDCFQDLYEAKQVLANILRWQIYVNIVFRAPCLQLSTELPKIDTMWHCWRQRLTQYGTKFANSDHAEFNKARKMIFQSKLFVMCRNAARNSIFVDSSRVQMISVDFSNPRLTSILCTLKRDVINETWTPLALKPERDTDDLDVWPQGEVVGNDGTSQIIRITIGR